MSDPYDYDSPFGYAGEDIPDPSWCPQDHVGEPAPHVEWQARPSAGSYVMLVLAVMVWAAVFIAAFWGGWK